MINNIVNIVINNAHHNPERIALIHSEEEVTYSNLISNVIRIASYFKERGISKGDRVLVFVPMSIKLYEIILAIFYIGAIAVFVDAWADKERIETSTKLANCKAFIGSPKSALLFLKSKEIRDLPVKLILGVHKFMPGGLDLVNCASVSATDTALITFTTGSTGIPKPANRTHEFLLEQHYALQKHLKLKDNDIDLATLPVFVLHNLAAGCTTIIPDLNPKKTKNINFESLVNLINKYSPTSTAGSPIFYEKLADYCLSNDKCVNKFKKIFLGGAPVYKDLAEKLVKAFPDSSIEIIYGSTEAEPISSINCVDFINTADQKGLPVGKPVDFINLKIIKITDEPLDELYKPEFESLFLPQNAIGEICISGKHVLKEYYKNEEAQKYNKVTIEGVVWHRTGDAGYLDDEGYLYLMGRVANRFEFNGITYFLLPIEKKLRMLDGVNLATIINLHNKTIIALELKKDFTGSVIQISDRIKELEIPYDEITLLDEIPKDPRHNSKIDYEKLKQMINKGA